jgi:Ca2+-binding EF-hand superfamily protein
METSNPEAWIEGMSFKIREVFELFDKDKTDTVVNEEVGTIMRALGVFPTERALIKDILPEMQDDEPTGFVSYARFEKKMLQILASKEWEPDGGDILLQAFRTIDTQNLGYIQAEVMEELLTKKAAFRAKEVEAFFLQAKDPETGNIYYEDYISQLTKIQFM